MKNKKERNLFIEQQNYIRQRIISLQNEHSAISMIEFCDDRFGKTKRDKNRQKEIKSQLIILNELLLCVKPQLK